MGNVHDGQKGNAGPDGEVLASRFVAMSPSTIARWAREGRSFRAVATPPDPGAETGEAGDGSDTGGGSDTAAGR